MNQQSQKSSAYWRANLKVMSILLVIWATTSLGMGIIFRPFFSHIKIGGTDIGFWFAQQGSILSFIVLIFFYAWWMNRLDHKFGVDQDDQ